MKIYKSDIHLPVSSVARKPAPFAIPVIQKQGTVRAGVSPFRWYPQYAFTLLSGYLTANDENAETSLVMTIYKNNIFESEGSFFPPQAVGTATLTSDSVKAIVQLNNPMEGGTVFTQYDWLTIGYNTTSGHSDAIVQLYAQRNNY